MVVAADSTTSSSLAAGTTRRVVIAQPWPAWVEAVTAAIDAAAAMSASSRTTKADFPPSSRNTRVMFSAAARITGAPGGGRAGERHDVDPGVAGELGAQGVVRGGDHVQHSGREIGLLGGDASHRRRAPRRVRRRLEHHRAPCGEGRAQLGEVDLVGEVPRGDGSHHACGLPPDLPVGGDPDRDPLTEVHLPPPVVLGEVRPEPEVLGRGVELRSRRQERRGAHLRRGEGPQVLALGLQGVAQLAQAPGPEGRVGGPAGLVERPAGRVDGRVHVRRGAVGGDAQDLLGGRVEGLEAAPAGGRRELAVDQQDIEAPVPGPHRSHSFTGAVPAG